MEDAPHCEGYEIIAGNYGEDTSYAVHWHDGSQNYWRLAGWYDTYDHLCAKPSRYDVWREFPIPPKEAE